MYNSHTHRGTHPANARLNDLLDQVRQEFDTQNGRAGEYENQRKFARSTTFRSCSTTLLFILHHLRLLPCFWPCLFRSSVLAGVTLESLHRVFECPV
jgi:hypothetical protein